MNASSGASCDLIRVLVAGSNQTQSQLLSSALRRQPGLRVACCRTEVSDCLQALRSAPIDIVLLGDGPANHDGLIETLRSLHDNHPRTGLILLLDSYDRNFVVSAMRAGVRGLFSRASQPFRALCRCISVVHQGQFWANTEQKGRGRQLPCRGHLGRGHAGSEVQPAPIRPGTDLGLRRSWDLVSTGVLGRISGDEPLQHED